MTIRQQAAPNFSGLPRVSFEGDKFDTLIYEHGYKIRIEDAIACPCKTTGNGHLSSCQNCLGLGWVFINPYETRALITSINKNTQYKYWSPELTGTVSVTLMAKDNDKLSQMDKVTILGKTSHISEVLKLRTTTTNNVDEDFVFLSYRPIEILSVHLFNGATNKLIKLTPSQYSINSANPYVLDLSDTIVYPTNYNRSISVYYSYEVQYNVVDLPHDMRASVKKNDYGQNEDFNLPIQAIARLAHLALGTIPNRDGTGLQNNNE